MNEPLFIITVEMEFEVENVLLLNQVSGKPLLILSHSDDPISNSLAI